MLDILLQSGSKTQEKGVLKISDRADKPVKSLLKSVSWRVVGTLDTMLISYFITGKVTFAVSIGSVEVITKTILYYFHERVWAHIHRFRINILKKQDGKRFEIGEAQQAR